MQQFLPTLFLFLLSFSLYAQCEEESEFTIFPVEEKLPLNGIVIIEGSHDYQPLTLSMGTHYPIYLLSDQEKVELDVLGTYQGDKKVSQVLLKPTEKLQPNKRYTLFIAGPDDLPERNDFNDFVTSLPPIETAETADTERPRWRGQPRMVASTVVYNPKGPATHANVIIEAEEEGPVWVRTELLSEDEMQRTIYVLPLKEQALRVGHESCLGPFTYDCKNCNYKIRFQLMDTAGLLSEDPSEWMTFDSPYMEE